MAAYPRRMPITRHVSKCLVAGVVAILPIGGSLFTAWYIEDTISGPWLVDQPFYFPGLGLILGVVAVYLIGLVVSTFVGQWLWKLFDRLLDSVPMLGPLYQSLKQVLGYGEGKDALFERVVTIESEFGRELGLVTGETEEGRTLVFVPGSPMPTTGRLVMADPQRLTDTNVRVSDALKTLVAMGKVDL